jgi:hypothetical protein
LHGWKTFVIIPYRKAFGETALNVEARMAELADALDSGSGQNPSFRPQLAPFFGFMYQNLTGCASAFFFLSGFHSAISTCIHSFAQIARSSSLKMGKR